jgi:ATP-binding protein involved in chromosome partitioning
LTIPGFVMKVPPMFGKKKTDSSDDGSRLHPTLEGALSRVMDPELGKDLVTLGMVKRAELDGDVARIGIELTTPACPLKDKIQADIEAAVEQAKAGTKVQIEWTAQVSRGRHGGGVGKAEPMPSLEKVQNIVLVASGKGGVGKSTVASNLACALARTGSKVGLLDADIYGPSVPTMFKTDAKVGSPDGKTIVPIDWRGVKLMSMGFLLPPDKAMIWRGPMVHGAIQQFLRDVVWGELDYLVVDLPPGTGDVQLTIAQSLKVTGAVIVSTPQTVALADVVRAKAMFDSVGIQVLGLIENMAWFECDGCSKKHYIFSKGGATEAAKEFGIPVLGELPIEPDLRQAGDLGTPLVESAPESKTARQFVHIARTMAGWISVLNAEKATQEELDGPSKAAKRSLPILG